MFKQPAPHRPFRASPRAEGRCSSILRCEHVKNLVALQCTRSRPAAARGRVTSLDTHYPTGTLTHCLRLPVNTSAPGVHVTPAVHPRVASEQTIDATRIRISIIILTVSVRMVFILNGAQVSLPWLQSEATDPLRTLLILYDMQWSSVY